MTVLSTHMMTTGHTNERCPWCGTLISRAKFLEIEAKILTEAQQREDIDKVIEYDKCVTVDVIDSGAAAVHACYAQLLASGFGAVR